MKKYQAPEFYIIKTMESDIVTTSQYVFCEDGIGDVKYWDSPNSVIFQ